MQRYLAFEKHPPNSMPKPDTDHSYLLYIHVPFCEELCSYCSFVKVKFEHSLASRYFDALKKELELYRDLGYSFNSIYIGGGTPTIMPDRLALIIEFAKNTWPIKQISVETNPGHLKPDIMRTLKDVGTNRLTVGIQSLNNEILENTRRLEKYGSGEEIKQALSSISGMFDTLNIDMIFNFPNQTEEMLAADIEIVKEIKPDQVTYYPLIVSDSKKEEISKTCGKINYEKEKRLYQLLVEELTDVYNQESIWCFSNEKGLIDEYIMNSDEYVGVGPGSWGYINGTMYSNTFSILQYINLMQENKSPITANRSFSYLEKMRYCFLFKLLTGTVSVSDMKEKYGNGFWLYLCKELLFLFTTRSVIFRNNNIVLTPKGQYYCLMLMRTFFSIVGDYRDMCTSSDTSVSMPLEQCLTSS